jgi:hypothetical protein
MRREYRVAHSGSIGSLLRDSSLDSTMNWEAAMMKKHFIAFLVYKLTQGAQPEFSFKAIQNQLPWYKSTHLPKSKEELQCSDT